MRAFNVSGESLNSNTAHATTAPTAPDLPSGLQVTGRSQTWLILAWNTAVGAASYELERGDGVTFTRVGTPAVATLMDRGLQPNTTYTYRVIEDPVYVDPTAVDVLNRIPGHSGLTKPGQYITLTTCDPVYNAYRRLIVFGQLVSSHTTQQTSKTC